MKKLTANKNLKLKMVLILTLLGLLSACGNSKSTNGPSGELSSNRVDINSQKPLATCNKAKDANFSINTSAVTDQTGQINNDWIKIKFNFLSADMTKAGNVLKFFKWKVTGTQAILEPTPLQVAAFDFSSGQTMGNLTASLPADQINGQSGFYIQLNDPNAMFQVLKIVAYNSTGTVIGNLNSLIPAFNASPEDYKFNSDGTARADILQQMHLLYGTSVAGQSAVQIKQSFDQYCF